jgi:hypothetical protein
MVGAPVTTLAFVMSPGGGGKVLAGSANGTLYGITFLLNSFSIGFSRSFGTGTISQISIEDMGDALCLVDGYPVWFNPQTGDAPNYYHSTTQTYQCDLLNLIFLIFLDTTIAYSADFTVGFGFTKGNNKLYSLDQSGNVTGFLGNSFPNAVAAVSITKPTGLLFVLQQTLSFNTFPNGNLAALTNGNSYGIFYQ